MTTTKDILIAARALIIEPKYWCKKTMAKRARNADGSLDRFAYCIIGACHRSSYDQTFYGSKEASELESDSIELLNRCRDIDSRICCPSLADWNDTTGRTHREVLELFDRAIAAA